MAANIFLTGVAYQGGLIPLSAESIEQAIDWNGVDAARNRTAFLWGRKYYMDAAWVEQQLKPKEISVENFDRVAELREYQNETYARQYQEFVAKMPEGELRDVVAKYLYKLMAYKDEYEVARLLTKPSFQNRVIEMWEAPESISYNLHPPLLRAFGLKKKMQFGPWFRGPLVMLRNMKRLRGTALDVFGYMRHRREERALIDWYRELIDQVIAHLTPGNLPQALEIAVLPDQIRGYEGIKDASIARVKKEAAEKLEKYRTASRQYNEQPV
jgi:indolepyruvate ferredoxin oxidoreductase